MLNALCFFLILIQNHYALYLIAIYHIYFTYNSGALFSLSIASDASLFDYCKNL